MSETGGALTMGTPSCSRIPSVGSIMPENEHMIANPDEDGSGEVGHVSQILFNIDTHLYEV